MSATNNLWCAMCGKWTDHQSGSCPEVCSANSQNDQTKTPPNSGDLVSLLRSCAETLDRLAHEYKRLGWDLTAERLASEASEHRRSANSFDQSNKNASDGPACECAHWCRANVNLKYLTNHHENCPRYNDSLIDVWKITASGVSAYTDNERDAISQGEFDDATISKEKMHREVFEHLPEFEGF